MKIVGVKHSTGEYQGHSYDNYIVYAESEFLKDNFGACGDPYKIKASLMHSVCAPDKIEKIIGRDLAVYYDLNKRITYIEIK